MTINLNASACPPVTQPTGFLSLLASKSAPVAPVSEQMISSDPWGQQNFRELTIQPHALRLDKISRSGGANACAIVAGSNLGNELTMVAGTGASVLVKKGDAIIGGIVMLEADTVRSLTNGFRNWVWLQQNGALLALTSTTPPATLSVLLGSVMVSGGVVTNIDTSGVVYLEGGCLVRSSADPGVPTDSPPSNLILIHKTPFGRFLWDGAAYRQIDHPSVTADPTSTFEGLQWFRSDSLTNYVWSGGAAVPFPSSVGGGSGVPASTVTEISNAGAVGTSTNFAREDHAHKGVHKVIGPSGDIFGDMTIGGAVTQIGNTLTIVSGAGTPATTVLPTDDTGAVGSSTNYAREDHTHRAVSSIVGPASTIFGDVTLAGGVSQSGNTLTFAIPPAPATTVTNIGMTGSVGTALTYAREDHQHPGVFNITGPGGTVLGPLTFTGSVSQSGNTFNFGGTGTPASSVTPVGSTAVVGTSVLYARADHQHDGVSSVNSLKGALTIAAGTGISLTPVGTTITIAATGGGGSGYTMNKAMVVSPGGGSLSWAIPTSTAASPSEFNASILLRSQHDLTNATQARLVIMWPFPGAALPIGFTPAVDAQYSTNGGTTWNYLDGTVGSASGAAVLYGAGSTVGSWVTLTGGAKADVLLRFVAYGGNGSTSLPFGTMELQVK